MDAERAIDAREGDEDLSAEKAARTAGECTKIAAATRT